MHNKATHDFCVTYDQTNKNSCSILEKMGDKKNRGTQRIDRHPKKIWSISIQSYNWTLDEFGIGSLTLDQQEFLVRVDGRELLNLK